MKKITILLEGNPSLTFTGKQIEEKESENWVCFIDKLDSKYTINIKYIVAIVIE